MKRLVKKLFPFLLLIASLVVVYLNDSTIVSSENRIYSENHPNGSSIFNIQENDVIVFLDIPGSGMESFSQSLVNDLITETPCSCPATKTRCSCTNKNKNPWLFQSYNSTGFVCGEHADWTTLTKCPIDQWMENVGHDSRLVRRYWMVTLIREPAARFVQEWHHLVTMDAYFRNEPRLFRKESVELQKKKLPCLVGKRIPKLTLQEFLDCKDNPALNRITRMLANITEVENFGYHGDKYDSALLASALANLEQLPFFGISEKSQETQILLEATLGLRFSQRLNFLPTKSHKPIGTFGIPANLLRNVRLANHLDVRVYDHALRLFDRQLEDITKAFPSLRASGTNKQRERLLDDKYRESELDHSLAYKKKDTETAIHQAGNVDENEDEDDDDDDDYNNNDERHERKMHIDESVLEFSVTDMYKKLDKNEIKDFDGAKNKFIMVKDIGKSAEKRYSDEFEEDKIQTGSDHADVNDVSKLDKIIDEEFNKRISEKIEKNVPNIVANENKNGVITRDDSNYDVSKTKIVQDTEDVNEFFNMLAESKRKQGTHQDDGQRLNENNVKTELYRNLDSVITTNPNNEQTLKNFVPPSPVKESPGRMATGPKAIPFRPQRNQNNPKRRPYKTPMSPTLPNLEFKPRLLQGGGGNPAIKADEQVALPKPALLPLGFNRMKDEPFFSPPSKQKSNNK